MSLTCEICAYEAIPFNENGSGDTFYHIKAGSITDHGKRFDNRRSLIRVCAICYEKYTGKKALSIGEALARLNEERKHLANK